MITYEEFLKQNNIDELHFLDFSGISDDFPYDAHIEDSPSKYLDIAINANNLTNISAPVTQSPKFYDELSAFVKNCNDKVKISNGTINFSANKEEFLHAEEILKSIVFEVNPAWSIKEKSAYIHYKMGEIVSYLPDFKFKNSIINSQENNDTRSIWKSVLTKKSVCNGISSLERNLLSRLGIETEELKSPTHSYVLIKTDEGNIISDPTWDLTNSLYKARPMHFGVTYEELRKREEIISNAHKLENPPKDVIKIQDEELRDIYQSIGIIDSTRRFPIPIFGLVDKINSINFETTKDKLNAFLYEFTQEFPNEATHLQETRDILEDALSELGIDRTNIHTKFVYSKDDNLCKNPHLSIHINSDNLQNHIKMLNLNKMNFDDFDIKEFDESYMVHNLDTVQPFWKLYLNKNVKEYEQEKEGESK